MKYLKILLIAVITAITFGSAKAQDVVVKARVGGPVHRHYHHRRVVVERRPIHHSYYWRHHRRHYRRY